MHLRSILHCQAREIPLEAFWHLGMYYDKPKYKKHLNFRPRTVSYKRASCEENETCLQYKGFLMGNFSIMLLFMAQTRNMVRNMLKNQKRLYNEIDCLT